MSKKISEKELNNVSGGCASGVDCYHELYCYDANNTQIGSVIKTKITRCISDANKDLFDKSKELYLDNINIKYIKWVYFVDYKIEKEGINYREIMLS